METQVIEEAKTPEKEKSKGTLALEEYRNNLTPEQKEANIEKAKTTRKENQEKKKEIEIAAKVLMKQKFKFRDANGKINYGNGYAARISALTTEVLTRGKNMIGAEKQLNQYLGENKEEEKGSSNEIKIIMVQGQEINI